MDMGKLGGWLFWFGRSGRLICWLEQDQIFSLEAWMGFAVDMVT